MSEKYMNADKLYDATEGMGLVLHELRPKSIWICGKNKYGVPICAIKYDKHNKYYELVANERTLYYGHSFDDLIDKIKEFYKNEICWNR